jgi:hypothetical protein
MRLTLPVAVFPVVLCVWGLAPTAPAAPIIADHQVVDRYDDIPQAYLDEVKKMWVSVAGESHSSGYRMGCTLLESLDARYQVNTLESGTPESYTDQYLRLSRATWGDVSHATGWTYSYGEEDWYTLAQAVTQTKTSLSYCQSSGVTLAAFGFGWCWDMTWHNNPGGVLDDVYQVHWAGSSVGGPEGDLMWGLDDGDTALTGNSVNLGTYLNATMEYIQHCRDNSLATIVFFTTGPVDGGGNTGENGYQRHLKNQGIRDFVSGTADGVLLDYADILCWSDAGVQQTTNWTDSGGTPHSYQFIHPDNMLDLGGSYAEDGDHIGQRGAVRVAKALWWMLARVAGWDGVTVDTPTETPTSTATYPPGTFTPTDVFTVTPTFTWTPTDTRTRTPTRTATATVSDTPTVTPTQSMTSSPTPTITVSSVQTITPSLTATMSWTETSSPTSSPSAAASPTPSPTVTATPSSTVSRTPTRTTTPLWTFTSTVISTSPPEPDGTGIPKTLVPNPVREGDAVRLSPRGPASVDVYTPSMRWVARWKTEDGWLPLVDKKGKRLANGLYHLEVQAGGRRETLKLMVLR